MSLRPVLWEGRQAIQSTLVDITERKRADERLRHMAHHDGLTGLGNRLLLEERLGHALLEARRAGGRCAVLMVDLDHFKEINDTLGHAVGDSLLRRVATVLRESVKATDTVARFGGDEFALVLADLRLVAEAADVAQRILARFAEPLWVAGRQLTAGVSIGIAVGPDDGSRGEILLKYADLALYRAKGEGRGTYRFYEEQMNAELQHRRGLGEALRGALRAGELRVAYQPQVGTGADAVVCGLEALCRWHSPSLGPVSPALFVPIAEQLGLIEALSVWQLEVVVAQIGRWVREGTAVPVSINLSARQFHTGDLPERIDRLLSESGLAPHLLEFEITETVAMQDPGRAEAVMRALKGLGVKLAIDDFGTGYSSLAYLKRFPVDKVKVDKSFVQDLEQNADDAAITRAVIQLGHSLGKRIVAEGVETEGQLSFLREAGCDIVQGYIYAPALAAESVPGWLRRHAANGAPPGRERPVGTGQ